MPPILTIRNISLSQVDFDDFSYSISPKHEIEIDETLRRSITRYGILHPPIVRENNSGLYSIVAGRKRLYALRSLQKKETCCCLTLSRQTPKIEVFRILLAEVQLDRQLTIVEKAIFLQKITPIADERQVAKEFMPRLNLAPDTFTMKQTLKLLDLEDPIILGMQHGYVNETIAHDFISLSARDRATLFEIIELLRPSFSNQKKLINICRELAGRENTSIAALLDNHEVYAILHHQDANPPQKTKNLMTWLSRKHKPRTLLAEEEFSRFVSAIRLPKNVSVAHTPFFEDDAVTLAITFRNRESLQKIWEKIKHATRDNDN
jgi:hypothetical protein